MFIKRELGEIMKFNLKHTSLLFSLALIGCGGGGASGGDTPTPTPVKAQLKAQEAIKAPEVIQSGKTTVLSYTVTNPVVDQVKIGAIGRVSNNSTVEIKGFDTPVTDGVELTYDLSLPQNTCFDENGQGKMLPAGDQCNIAFLAKLNGQVAQETNKRLTLAVRTSENAEDLEINKSLKFVPENDARLIDLSSSVSMGKYLAPGIEVKIQVTNNAAIAINALKVMIPQWLEGIAEPTSTNIIDELPPQSVFTVSFKLPMNEEVVKTLEAHKDSMISITLEAANANGQYIADAHVISSPVTAKGIMFDSPKIEAIVFTNQLQESVTLGDHAKLENVANNTMTIVTNGDDCLTKGVLKAGESCQVNIEAAIDAHPVDYTKEMQLQLPYETNTGVTLTAHADIKLKANHISMQNNVHLKPGAVANIAFKNEGAFNAFLPDIANFSITRDGQIATGVEINQSSTCLNAELKPKESCQLIIHADNAVPAKGHLLTVLKANNMADNVAESFYIDSSYQSVLLEESIGSIKSNMSAIKLTNNGDTNVRNISLDRTYFPESVTIYDGKNGSSDYGVQWCNEMLCPDYCQISSDKFDLLQQESCYIYFHNPSNTTTSGAELTITALNKDYVVSVLKKTDLFMGTSETETSNSSLYRLTTNESSEVMLEDIKAYLHTNGKIESYYWIDNDDNHTTLAVVVDDGGVKRLEILKNIAMQWVNLHFPSESYSYLGIRASYDNHGNIYVLLANNQDENLISVIGTPEGFGYVWQKLGQRTGTPFEHNDLKIVMDMYNNSYMVDIDKKRLNKIDLTTNKDSTLYRSETEIISMLYFAESDHIAVIDKSSKEGQFKISLFNHKSQTNTPVTSYLLPKKLDLIYAVKVIPETMKFYIYGLTDYEGVNIDEYTIAYDNGHFGDMSYQRLAKVPEGFHAKRSMLLVDHIPYLIDHVISEQDDYVLYMQKYVDGQWINSRYASSQFQYGHIAEQLGYQYHYDLKLK